nr:LOW QUALITY PROTEIN: zinc finger homeobox protein 3-like [Labrus bergylta]
MDSEGGGGDGGGGEDRDADLSPQALSLPLLTLEVSPEQGSSSHTSATAPAKEPLTLPQQQEEEGAEGSQAREETQGGVQEEEGGRHLQENGACQKQGMKEDFGEGYLSGRREEEAGVHGGVGEASVTGGLPAALCSSSSGEKEKEEEEAISNQSQTKSKCSLLPQQSQHSSSSSTAKASGTLDNKTAASPKPSPTPSASPKPSPFLSTSPKHFTCPSSSPTLQSETEVKDIKGDQGWISEFPQSFKSQPSTLAGMEPASTPAEDVGPAGGPHSSISSVDGAKAPEPNDSQLDTEVDDEREQEEEQKEAVLKNLNPELSPNSLTSHMTIMHSRNSCKTLKCPKCNWHYKSQHTLQVHMKEKHPETGGQCVCGSSGGKCICGGATRDVCGYCSSGKAHPRLARGETYACGYKPYRCEVCDYATSSKGNLSIHMQSDKHLNNVQNGGHSNGHLPTSHVANNSSSSNGPTAEEPAYKLPLCIPSPTAQPAKLTPPAHSHSHGKRWRCDVCDYETSIARNLRIHTTSEKHTHNMLRLQRGYYLSHCRSLAPQLKNLQNTGESSLHLIQSKSLKMVSVLESFFFPSLCVLGAELSLNMRLTSQQLAEQPVTLGSALTPSPSPSPSPPPAPSLSPTGPLSQGVFQCLVCSCFSSDSLESVEQHLNATRSLPQSMWCSLVAGGCHCRLCGYTTPLRANFSLHCQTDRHRIRYQLAAHLQEGGDRGQEGEALIAKGNPVQLRCNLCDCVTSSLEKLRGHSLGSHHKASVRVYRFLQQYDGEVDGGSWLFHCLLCNHSSSSKLQVLKHSQTATHQQREGLLQLQPMGGEELAAIFTIRKIPDGDQGEFGEDIETSSETTTGPLDTTKDKCILISEETGISVENGTLVENAEEEVATPKDVTALLTPPLEDNTTHHSNGRLAPQSPTQFPPSSPPSSPASDPPPLSDRHGYRFRCSRCSLAFPTQEKLQLHWQYHAMRAATECPICSRQCRSQEALHRHMQNTHSQLDNTQGQNTLPTPHTTQFMEINKSSFQQNLSLSPQVGQEAGEAEDEDMEEEEAIDMNRKEETKEGVEFEEKDMIDETDGSEEELTELEKGLHGEIRSEPSSSSPVKRGSNPTMDRYLDPTRPYKCTICSESFTQKTILLVHYNSVSHLHRARRALQDPGTCVTAPEAPRGPDPRPYRCRLCGVGYSQSSTLDIHLRSVLHQTRARAAQNSAPQTPASSVAAPVSVSTTATQAATTREDKTSKCFTKRPNVVSSSTSSLFQGVPAEAQSTLPNPTIVEAGYSRSSVNETERQPGNSSLEEGKEEMPVPTVKNEGQKRETDPSPCNVLGLQCPPPRIPYASVNGEPLRALLQSYGFELALQYIQSRHRNQQQISTHVIPDKQEYCDNKEIGVLSEEKREKVFELQDVRLEGCNTDKDGVEVNGGIEDLPQDEVKKKEESGKKCCGRGKECRDCGKFFSDSLILKSHQEYIHRSLFPTAALERFSREYRLQYDQMYPLPQPKSGEDLTTCPQAAVQAPSSESETAIETVRPQVKTLEPLPSTSVSELVTKTCSPASDPSSTAPPPSSPVHSQPQDFSQEAVNPSTSATVTSHTTSQATSIPLPLPMLPLSLPQLSMPPLTLPKLSLPPGPFPMELPLLSPLVMQSVALQSKPWLDSNVNPELAKLYQSQLNQALLGQQPQLNPRTRISEEQLTVLRKHFDINSLPSDQEINKMSALAGLPLKVIKHWFRNTLFKERQRDKDSPYNFNNPPTIALEESRKEMAQSQPLSLSPCSLSPGLPVNISPEPLTTDIQREELHRGRRSSRTRFTEQQLETLQRVFEATPYPREEEYDRLSARLSLSNRVIVVWFQNARQRARKHQDQGNDDGSEGKNQHDNIHRQRNGRHKNEDYDNDDNSCGDERHSESQNENSMDLTYEYYTHPDSPFVDSTSSCPESEHPTAKDASTPVTGNQEDKIVPHLENTNTDFVQTQNGISDADIKHKDIVPAIKTDSSPKPEPTLQPERTAESPAPCSTSSSQKNELTILPRLIPVKGGYTAPFLIKLLIHQASLLLQSKKKATSCLIPTLAYPQKFSQIYSFHPKPRLSFSAVFAQCLCHFQLWQEHQTRHLLAAQSQVQFLHSGFPERSMPYMMLHPNHTLMASQMLSGAMSQMPSTSLTSLSQTSLATIKQNSKIISEGSFEGQRSSREIDEEQRRDKRQRTTITPEQLEVLYQRYSMDSNPTRGVLESIARDVGLTRRVVQVWFQNTRARERKGQFRSLGPGSNFSLGFNHLRCPFCRALFKVKSALDAHMRSRHWTEAERAGYNLSMSNGSNGQIGMAMSSVMDRPGPSVSFYPNHGIAISNNQLTVKPSMTSLSTTDLKNQEEEDDYEEDEEEYPCEEGSSLADQGSPSPEGSGGPGAEWGETQALQQQNHQQQRQRTQMSHYQVMQLRDFYRSHRNPNRHECEALGQELGLPHRVVQVWFQNARAKEKRARSLSSDAAEREQAELSAGAGERDRA